MLQVQVTSDLGAPPSTSSPRTRIKSPGCKSVEASVSRTLLLLAKFTIPAIRCPAADADAFVRIVHVPASGSTISNPSKPGSPAAKKLTPAAELVSLRVIGLPFGSTKDRCASVD